ncbi:MAG: DUF3800 domain-containing protein [Chloroflexia bacterium]|nr:DUF3800 domain-containing protein [Chloroflexia bacterium]
MARRYLFVDEAGNFDFKPSGTRYLVLASIALDDCAVGDALLALRREMVWDGIDFAGPFHAASDKQRVRDRVFGLLAEYPMRVDATVFEKANVEPARRDEERFYGLAWLLHLRRIAKDIASSDDELMVVGASIGTRRRQEALASVVREAVLETAGCAVVRIAYWSAASDPCLQAADYCCWAIQRAWERGDPRSRSLIQHVLASEVEAFADGGADRE